MKRRTVCQLMAGTLGAALLGGTRADARVTADLTALKSRLGGKLLMPGDEEYEAARKLWNGAFDYHPAAIGRCTSADDVRRCVEFVRTAGLPVAVRGGGHSFAGQSGCDDGFVIDLSAMRSVRVDRAARRARVEPGAWLADLDAATLDAGLVTSTGTVSDTGVAGFTLGGGFGRMARRLGLACDNLVGAQVVTADGKRLRADARDNPDLFWALRGGGGNFGVVTEFEFQLHDTPPSVIGGGLAMPFDQPRAMLSAYAEISAAAPDELCTLVDIVPTPEGKRMFMIDVCHSGTPQAAARDIARLRKIGKVVDDTVRATPYRTVQTRIDANYPRGRGYYLKSGFAHGISPALIDTLVDHLGDTAAPRCVAALLQLGGAISRVAPEATAYWYRGASHHVLLAGVWNSPEEEAAPRAWVKRGWAEVEPHTRGFYVNLLAPDEAAPRVKNTYGGNFQRLTQLKRRYDPTNLFRRNANIAPA